MTIEMSQFFQVFFDEAEELLAEMEKLLLAIDVSAPAGEDLHAVFRAAHSLKGGAATFGLADITDVTHVLESLLDRIRNGDMALESGHVDAFLATKDVLKNLLDGHRHGATVDRNAAADVQMLLQSLLPDAAPSGNAAPVEAGRAVEAGARGESLFRIRLPALSERDVTALVAELGLLGSVEQAGAEAGRHLLTLRTAESRNDIVAICSFIMDPDDLTIDEERIAAPDAAAIKAQEDAQGYGFFEPFEPAGGTSQVPAASGPLVTQPGGKADVPGSGQGVPATGETRRQSERPAAGQESSSIRVGIEKVDQLINLVGELVITQAMVAQRAGVLDPIANERLLESISHIARNTRALQEAVMSIRMMPMDYVFSRFPRMVRDLAVKLGKKVEFVTQGAATELDKGLIERIVDPLTHLVRNSIDHGIEAPAARRAAGKNETGRLSLSAAHQGGNIVIEVTDDGGGLNRERILDKAREKGIPASDAMPDADVWQLIFAPGFSTAEQVTDVSGRGVGMDVVKRNIAAMGGSVDIRSSRGFGTVISISLPLTLAILDGMSIRVGEEIYILPLGYVVESLQPAGTDVKDIQGQGRVVKVRGEYLPLLPLHEVFDIAPTHPDPCRGIVVIVESEGKKAALLIDELVGQQQVVVKNLESNYRKVAGISGATILGDGGVSLIVDVAALLRSGQRFEEAGIA
ncbi:MAG: chemotaxis protein CheA [Burkholderiaceae bacterium]